MTHKVVKKQRAPEVGDLVACCMSVKLGEPADWFEGDIVRLAAKSAKRYCDVNFSDGKLMFSLAPEKEGEWWVFVEKL